MITFIERLQNEKANLGGNIVMYEDGSEFIKAYERSAFMLCNVFKPMEPLVLNNKEYGGPYIKIGFPKNKISTYICHPDYDYHKNDEGKVIVHTLIRKVPIDFPENGFLKWKDNAVVLRNSGVKKGNRMTGIDKSIPLKEEAPGYSLQTTDCRDSKYKHIINDIMAQQLSNYTPMLALNYLNSLQERIKNEGLSD